MSTFARKPSGLEGFVTAVVSHSRAPSHLSFQQAGQAAVGISTSVQRQRLVCTAQPEYSGGSTFCSLICCKGFLFCCLGCIASEVEAVTTCGLTPRMRARAYFEPEKKTDVHLRRL